LLRVITCGSVDDGKSTLLGRLLVETGSAFPEELDACEGDLSRLVDGLEAEREQGITIDVAYRYFSTSRRTFIVADAPGHEQYTRNFITGASTADIALLLVDATKGVLPQTRRHSFLCALLGVPRLVLLVNKMDLVGYREDVFAAIVESYAAVREDFTAIAVSAFAGANVTSRSAAMPWYRGATLLEHLESVEAAEDVAAAGPLRMPVHWVQRDGVGFRGVAGRLVSGSARPGDPVRVMPGGRSAAIARILCGEAELAEAAAGQSVTLVFDGDLDCARGDTVAGAAEAPDVADQFEATIVWMSETELTPGRQYVLKLGTQSALATLMPPKHEVDIATFDQVPARTLGLNGIGVANLWTDRPLVFAPYAENRALGGFILIARSGNETVGAGLIHHSLRRSHNVREQLLEVTPEARAAIKGQRPALLWFTGLSGAGKSTIANLVEAKLHAMRRHSFMLDGDNVRLGLCRDLGFSDAHRAENIRRVAETAKLMMDAGLIVLAALISPFRAERRMVREMFPEGAFVEIFVDTPLEEAERRDAKGLYADARAGRIPNFTGIGSPYEAPERPEIRIDTTRTSAEEAAEEIVRRLLGAGPAPRER
jgi:bifunctional enzyme CysN/CysC